MTESKYRNPIFQRMHERMAASEKEIEEMRRRQTLSATMNLQDLATLISCPPEFKEHFEHVMMEKYGIREES